MMKKTSLIIRIMSLVMVFAMSFAMMSMTAFAAEEGTTPDTEMVHNNSTRADGDILNSGSADFVNTVTIPVYLSSGNWSADFMVNVSGNTGAYYQVDLTTPGGTTFTSYVYSNASSFTNIATFSYASSGTYYFKFTKLSGSNNTAHAIAEICD